MCTEYKCVQNINVHLLFINDYSTPCTYIHCVADTEETMGITGLLIYFGIFAINYTAANNYFRKQLCANNYVHLQNITNKAMKNTMTNTQ